jgi:hypothetical protein
LLSLRYLNREGVAETEHLTLLRCVV